MRSLWYTVIAMWFVLLILMNISTNLELARVEAERDFLFNSYWTCYNQMQLRIEQLKLNQAYLETKRNELLGLHMPKHLTVKAEEE